VTIGTVSIKCYVISGKPRGEETFRWGNVKGKTGEYMVLRGVSVHWIVHGSERSISALDSAWF
jgi:hypothetical protein